MRRRLIWHFIEDHPITALLIGVTCLVLVYLGYRAWLAVGVVMEFY